jgi:hypothetical protein
MSPALLSLPAAFGLAGAAGLNATLPLVIVSLLARLGLIHLAAPFDALETDIAFYGLLVLAVIEFAVDKVPALDSVGHAVMLPVSAAAGAVLFASQTGAVDGMHPGVAVLVSVLAGGGVAAGVHTVRATVRPVANLGLMGPPLSLIEDGTSAVLAVAAVLMPIAVPFLLVLLVVAAVLLWQRRRSSRPPALSAR